MKCTLLNGSYIRRFKGKCDIFFGIVHRLRKEDMEELFNREAKGEWRFATDAARVTDERASSEDQRTHQEEFLLQSTATWEQLLERKKEQTCPSQDMIACLLGGRMDAWNEAILKRC